MTKISEQSKKHIVFVTGGVLSSLGKGVLTSALGTLLEAQGDKVTAMKLDPYINVDAGTMNPKEHGEVFVTEDGFETDQDLGNYERFTNHIITSKNHSVTNGQIWQNIINKERSGDYGGKCVEYSAITNEIISRILKVQEETNADYTLVELGGTVGETLHQWFLDALRLMKFDGHNIVFIHMGLVPTPSKVGEQKTKPLQESIHMIRGRGIIPDFIVGRSELPLDEERKKKIARNCSIPYEHIISANDVDNIYKIPVNLLKQEFDIKLLGVFNERFRREKSEIILKPWLELVNKIDNIPKEKILNIGMVGKYQNTGAFTLADTYISVIQSLKIAAWHQGYNVNIRWINSEDFEKYKANIYQLDNLECIVVPGGFGSRGIEGKINAIKHARLNKIPFLGLCYGLQLAVVEYARNVLNLKDANSEEVDKNSPHPVIHILPEQAKKLAEGDFGGSMRLGSYEAELKEGTIAHNLYNSTLITERHRHRLEVNQEYVKALEEHGLIISGINPQRNLVEFIELPTTVHPFFLATQAHPEFKSRFMHPSPPFKGLIQKAIERKNNYITPKI